MDNKEYTVSEIVDSFGINGHTWLMFVLLGFAMIFDGYDFMIVNSTNMFVAPTFWPDVVGATALMGSLTTWGLLGMVIGGAVGGIVSDKIGRKKMLTIAVIFYGLFTLPQAFAHSYAVFAAFRLIAGLGVGSCIPIVTTCFSETMPSKQRGIFVTFGMAFMVGGWCLAGIISGPICNNPEQIMGFCEQVTYQVDETTTATMFANWRICYLIGAIPILYGLILWVAMKETPHWYANSGRKEDAVKALNDLSIKSGKGELNLDPNLMVVPPKPSKTGPAVLFSKKFIVGTAAIWTLYFVGQFCVYGMNAWIPTWFKGVGYSPQQAVNLQTWNNFAAILSNVSVGIVADKIGRKKNLIFAWLMAIAFIILCSIFVKPNAMGLCIVLMLLFGFALNYAITAVQPLMPESYPTAIRNTGVSWCQAFARFGGSASSIVLGAIAGMAAFQTEINPADPTAAPVIDPATGLAVTYTNWSAVVLVLCIFFALGEICTLWFVRETGGKSMDQLVAEMGEDDPNDTGKTEFAIIMVIAAILFVLCIICPLVIAGFNKLPIALPLFIIGLILPFIYFFIFGGKQVKADKARRAA